MTGTAQLLFAEDMSGNMILLGYLFPAGTSLPQSLQNYTSSSSGLTLSAESTALALILTNPALAGVGVTQQVQVAANAIAVPDFGSLVGQIEEILINDPANVLNFAQHPEVFLLAGQISVNTMQGVGNTVTAGLSRPSLAIAPTNTLPRSCLDFLLAALTSWQTSIAEAATVVVNTAAAYPVENYKDPRTGRTGPAFFNDVFVSYVADVTPPNGVSPIPPILIDRPRALKLGVCKSFPFVCSKREAQDLPFELGTGDYSITIWKGFAGDIWLPPTRCLTNPADVPCLATQLSLIDLITPLLATAGFGIEVTAVRIVNSPERILTAFRTSDVAELEALHLALLNAGKAATFEFYTELGDQIADIVVKRTQEVVQLLKSSGIQTNKGVIEPFANADPEQMSRYLKRHATLYKKLTEAYGSIANAVEAGSSLIPMVIDWFHSPEQVPYYMTNRKLVERLPRPVSLDLVPPGPFSFKVGDTVHLEALARRDDGSTIPITSDLQWSVTGGIGSVHETTGRFTATTVGSGFLTVQYKTLSASSQTISVQPASQPLLQKIVVSGPAGVAPGQTGSYTALGVYSDGSTKNLTNNVSWTVDGNVGTMDQRGVLTATAGSGRVIATFSGQSSASSPITSGLPLTLFPPAGLQATQVTDTQITLGWSASQGATSFIVYRNGARIGSSTVTSFTDGGLNPSTTYTYAVSSFNPNGGNSQPGPSMTVKTLPKSNTPGPPTITAPGTGNPPGSTVASLTPTFSWNAVSGASRYGLYVSKEPYGQANIVYQAQQIPATATSHTIPSGQLQNGVKYRWDMTTFTATGGESDHSSNLYFQTPTGGQGIVTVANTGGIGLRLRTAASSSASILATLPEGTQIAVIGGPTQADGFTWWNLSGSPGTGWSAVAEWLTPITPTLNTQVTVTFTGGLGLRLRECADLSCAQIANLSDGTIMTVIAGPTSADGFTWWRLTGTPGTGWSAVGNWLVPNPRQ